jgi:phage/plasmid-like protein (TIGR03299 family)
MAYYGEIPWHKLGTPVAKGATAGEMINAAGLDWEVALKPARGATKINKKGEFSRYEVVRLPRPGRDESEVLLGLVGRRYKPLQNAQAFEFFNPIVAQGHAYFETAGALGEGERVWVMAKVPGEMEIVAGDPCLRYLLLSNSHSGEGAVLVKFTSVRVVCNNTLLMAMKDGQKAYRVRHTRQMHFRLNELSDFLAMVQHIFMQTECLFRRLARVQMPKHRLTEYFDQVYPRTPAQKKAGTEPDRWGSLDGLLSSQSDLLMPGVRGTLWAAYNAITHLEDYRQPRQEERPSSRLERTWFGTGADTKLKALEAAKRLADDWS